MTSTKHVTREGVPVFLRLRFSPAVTFNPCTQSYPATNFFHYFPPSLCLVRVTRPKSTHPSSIASPSTLEWGVGVSFFLPKELGYALYNPAQHDPPIIHPNMALLARKKAPSGRPHTNAPYASPYPYGFVDLSSVVSKRSFAYAKLWKLFRLLFFLFSCYAYRGISFSVPHTPMNPSFSVPEI